MTKSLYGWAHVFAVWDILRKKRMSWEATGGGAKKSTSRIWRAVALWGGTTSVVWIGVSAIRMVQYDPISFLFLLVAGLLYAAIVAMALLSRGSEKISPRLNELAARLVVLGRRRRVDVAGSE
jgi:cellulose synthase (UDP-forming)